MAQVFTEKQSIGQLDDVTFWQTGRWYSDKGQRIACTAAEDGSGRFVFLDYDRGIDGVTDDAWAGPTDPVSIRAWVMNAYDHGQYSHTREQTLVRMLGLVCKYKVAEAS